MITLLFESVIKFANILNKREEDVGGATPPPLSRHETIRRVLGWATMTLQTHHRVGQSAGPVGD